MPDSCSGLNKGKPGLASPRPAPRCLALEARVHRGPGPRLRRTCSWGNALAFLARCRRAKWSTGGVHEPREGEQGKAQGERFYVGHGVLGGITQWCGLRGAGRRPDQFTCRWKINLCAGDEAKPARSPKPRRHAGHGWWCYLRTSRPKLGMSISSSRNRMVMANKVVSCKMVI